MRPDYCGEMQHAARTSRHSKRWGTLRQRAGGSDTVALPVPESRVIDGYPRISDLAGRPVREAAMWPIWRNFGRERPIAPSRFTRERSRPSGSA